MKCYIVCADVCLCVNSSPNHVLVHYEVTNCHKERNELKSSGIYLFMYFTPVTY